MSNTLTPFNEIIDLARTMPPDPPRPMTPETLAWIKKRAGDVAYWGHPLQAGIVQALVVEVERLKGIVGGEQP